VHALEKAAVVLSLRNLLTFPFVAKAVEAEEMTLHGLWTSMGEGSLEVYDPETGGFVAL